LNAIGFFWDPLESAWEDRFAALTKFKAREGHCQVPQRHIEGSFSLGTWVSHEREKRDTMSAERKQRFDAIGFAWDPRESAWEEGFAALTKFKAREGHCRVPDDHVEGTYTLGTWVGVQRNRRKDTMSAERKQRLNAIGFVWDPLGSAWEEGFAALKKFRDRKGHCRVPALHVEGKFKLGGWVRGQIRVRDSMSAERKQRLDAIEFVWAQLESAWEDGFTALTKFKDRKGHCRVPQGHIEGSFRLGNWITQQRTKRDKMSAERKQRLDDIGFVWNPHESAWETGCEALKTFQSREGHCRVPAKHVEGKFRLGKWVLVQRTNKDTLSTERRQRLDEIGFTWRVQ
jgi:Helicase associated domain